MDALNSALGAMKYYESIENAERANHQRQAAETYALLAIAQELRAMNERAEAAEAYREVQASIALYAAAASAP